MDLRQKSISPGQMSRLRALVRARIMGYQPLILSDDLELGAGEHFIRRLPHLTLHWKDHDPVIEDLLTSDVDLFRKSNASLRQVYEHFLDSIAREVGDLSGLSCAEIGCNNGYFLLGLALRGAGRCLGYDCSPNGEAFAVLNEILGTRCEFRLGEWNCLEHRLDHAKMPEVDVCLSVAVTCHLADPIQHLAYLCDHSRKAVFLYSSVTGADDLSMSFGKPARYYKSLAWPISFDNNVRLSVPLTRLCLEEAGFRDIREVKAPEHLAPEWKQWYGNQRGFLALRTDDVRTALSPACVGRTRRLSENVIAPERWWKRLLRRARVPV